MKHFKSILVSIFFLYSANLYAETNLMNLKSNKAIYSVGETPVLQATVLSKPNNSDFEFDITAKLNNIEIPTSRITDFQMFSNPKNLIAGSYEWQVTLVIQDASYARNLKSTITHYRDLIFDLDDKISVETDPAVLEGLQNRKADAMQIKAAAESELQSIRTNVSIPKTIQFSVQ